MVSLGYKRPASRSARRPRGSTFGRSASGIVTPPRAADVKIDWKVLSKRIGHADVAFTMKQYVQTDLEADRLVANTLAELIFGGNLTSAEVISEAT